MPRLLIEGDPVGAVLAAAKLELRVLDLGVGALPLVGVLRRRGGGGGDQTASLEPVLKHMSVGLTGVAGDKLLRDVTSSGQQP